MNATTVAVDLAKNLFQLAYADANWKLVRTARLTRSQFRRCFQNSSVSLVIMEACGSAHYWARQLQERGIEVRLLPARYVRAYVKRNKTDAADAAALLEAARCADIQPVRIKSVEQQALQSLHRTRSLWMSTRTSRINALRGFCREFGIDIALGARLGLEQIARVLADSNSLLPELLRPTMRSMVEEIHLLEVRINDLEKQLGELARQSAACTTLLSVPGVGLLTATAMVAATSGEVSHFKDARHFAAWFGLTPKEHSSGQTRRIGRISKRGDRYLRMLLTHGARAVINAANVAIRMQRPVDRCDAGHCRSSNAAITTRLSVPSPTSSHASATPCCVITNPTASHVSTTNCSRRPSQCPPESIDHIATLAQRLIARHGSQDRVHTARCQ